jgi:ATPase complex subunit ATP10
MRFSKGKSFVAPPNIFKSDLALYFPNLRGQTLLKDRSPKDTTPAFEDRISIVSIFSTRWAENQTDTFVSNEKNKELQEVVRNSKGLAQMAQINLEENWMKAMLVKLFMPRLRKQFEESAWGRYFLIRKGFKQEMKEAMGLLNTKVGYIYVLDGQCRIRWAGSGNSSDEEKEGLVKAVRKLIEQSKAPKEKTILASPKKMTEARNSKKPATTAASTT